MHRIQVQLTDEQERLLRELAPLRGKSISALIREGVDRLLAPDRAERDALWERAEGFVGSVSEPAGPTDVSENHDNYIAGAIYQHKVLALD